MGSWRREGACISASSLPPLLSSSNKAPGWYPSCHGALTSVAKQRCSAAHPQGAITPFLQAEGYHPVFHPLNRDAPSLSYVVQVSSKTVQSLSEARNLTGRRRKRYELRSGGHVPPAGAARLPAGMAPDTSGASSRNVRTPRQAAKFLCCKRTIGAILAERRSRNMSPRPFAILSRFLESSTGNQKEPALLHLQNGARTDSEKTV